MDDLLDELMEKYWMGDSWMPVEHWEAHYLVDLEILANGELQRRGEEDGTSRQH